MAVQFNRIGSMFCLYFMNGEIWNLADAQQSDKVAFAKFFHGCLERRVYFAPSQFEAGFLSLAHTEADITRTADIAFGGKSVGTTAMADAIIALVSNMAIKDLKQNEMMSHLVSSLEAGRDISEFDMGAWVVTVVSEDSAARFPLDPASTGQAPVFSRRRVEGVTVNTLRLSQTLVPSYAVFAAMNRRSARARRGWRRARTSRSPRMSWNGASTRANWRRRRNAPAPIAAPCCRS